MGLLAKSFFVLLAITIGAAHLSRQWRLILLAWAFMAGWCITHLTGNTTSPKWAGYLTSAVVLCAAWYCQRILPHERGKIPTPWYALAPFFCECLILLSEPFCHVMGVTAHGPVQWLILQALYTLEILLVLFVSGWWVIRRREAIA